MDELYSESTSLRLQPASECIVNRDIMLCTTNEAGIFTTDLSLSYDTVNEVDLVLYAILEGSNSFLPLTMKNQTKTHHSITLPKKCNHTLSLSISNLPVGTHIVYFMIERKLTTDNRDFSNRSLSQLYLCLQVKNSAKVFLTSLNTILPHKTIASHKKRASLYICKDEYGLDNVTEMQNGYYYIAINNNKDFGENGFLYIIGDRMIEQKYTVNVPAQSQVVLPITWKNKHSNNKIRVIFFANPTKSFPDFPGTLRIAKSCCLPIKKSSSKKR